MAETDKLAWLRGPAAPVADSILSCGIISETATVRRPVKVQAVRASDPEPAPSKPEKRLLRQKWQTKTGPMHSFNILHLKTAPLPEPCVLPSYKPPPLGPEGIDDPRDRHVIPRPDRKYVLNYEPQKKGVRAEILALQSDVDAKIAELFPSNGQIESHEELAVVRNGMLQVYNYAFNEIIQWERASSVPKAMFLLRLKEFYNSVISELPRLVRMYGEEKGPIVEEVHELRNRVETLMEQKREADRAREVAERKLNEIEEMRKSVDEKLGEKEVAVTSLEYDVEFANGRVAQLMFKMNNKRDKRRALKNSLDVSNGEIGKQLEQIEDLEAKLHAYQEGETGYIVLHREALMRVEELKVDIKGLEQEIFDIKNIPKEDKAVDTTGLPTKKRKGKKKGAVEEPLPPVSQPPKGDGLVLEPRPAMALIGAQRSIIRLKAPVGGSSAHGKVSVADLFGDGNPAPPAEIPKQKLEEVACQTTETMTDLVHVPVVVEQVESRRKIRREEYEYGPQRTVARSLRNVVFETSKGYVLDHDKMFAIPDMHMLVMPLLSGPFIDPLVRDPQILSLVNVHSVVKNEKPLIWGLQLIHCFMCDPFARSVEHGRNVPIEDIIVQWLGGWFKLPPLTKQGIADLTRICAVYKTNPMIELFNDMVENKFSLAQVCFMATLYSFTCDQTVPGLNALATMLIDPDELTTSIDIRVAHRAVMNAFTEEMADICLEKLTKTEDPMIDYIGFLRHSAKFFADHHRGIYRQAVDLLYICGCTDRQVIIYEAFEYFMMFIGHEVGVKDHWTSIVRRMDEPGRMISLTELLMACTERKNLLMALLQLPTIQPSVQVLACASQNVRDMFHSMLSRCRTLIYVAEKEGLLDDPKIVMYRRQLKTSLLGVDLGAAIWYYRMALIRIDRLVMDKSLRVPFDPKADSDVFGRLREYVDMSEKSAFALAAANR